MSPLKKGRFHRRDAENAEILKIMFEKSKEMCAFFLLFGISRSYFCSAYSASPRCCSFFSGVINALKECGLEVLVLGADEHYPDSIFVEDVALLTKNCAIITNPGAPSRKGETAEIKKILSDYYADIEEIHDPGMVEAGDIMMVGSHFYIGLSERTNAKGAQQVIDILKKHEMSGSVIKLEKVLHLKTGLAYLEKNNLVACGEFLSEDEFQKFNILAIDDDESYAANCIWVNGRVLIPKGHPKAQDTIESAGYSTLEVDVSEFQKLDGGLSCLSLRF